MNDLPVKRIDKHNQKVYQCSYQNLLWQKTENCSYERFFGRGKLSEHLTEKNILIIGVGAIGSSLAKTLTRCGCKKLTIVDYDIIESGNICRSEYSINSISLPKVAILYHDLIAISPYVSIEMKQALDKALPNMPNFLDTKNTLASYDLIFDCSTDNEMAFGIRARSVCRIRMA